MFVKKSHPGSGMPSHKILPLMPQAFYIAKQSFTREAYFIQPRQRMDFIEKSTLVRAFFLASLKGFAFLRKSHGGCGMHLACR